MEAKIKKKKNNSFFMNMRFSSKIYSILDKILELLIDKNYITSIKKYGFDEKLIKKVFHE